MSDEENSQSEKVSCSVCHGECLEKDTVECNGERYCPQCADSYLRQCVVCGNNYNVNATGSWGDMCPSCGEEHFVCDDCGGFFSDDDYAEDGLCRDCYSSSEEHLEHVRPYHHSAFYAFHPLGETLYFGVELETDSYDSRKLASEALFDLSQEETLFFMEEDGSLDRGIEIISQPCSLDYHKHNFPWEEIVSIVRKYGGKSHDTVTCGLHIHFSRDIFRGRKDKLYQLRLVYFFEKFWAEMVKFSRRQGSWEHNARKYDIPIYDKPASKKLYDIKRDFYRYQAVNLTCEATIEIRIFRGSLKVSTILAALELVDFLIHLVKEVSNQEIQTITWGDVVERVKHSKCSYLYSYLKDVGLAGGGQNVLDSCET